MACDDTFQSSRVQTKATSRRLHNQREKLDQLLKPVVMSLSNSSSSGEASSVSLSSSCPHPDSVEGTLVQELRNAVNTFDGGSAPSLTAVIKSFNNAKAALDHAAPASSQHESSYSFVAKEVHAWAMKLILKANGATASPAVTSALHAVHSCARFCIRCAGADKAARTCVTVLKLLNSGERSPSSSRDFAFRRDWTESFLAMCINEISEELDTQGRFEAACLVMMQCKDVVENIHGGQSKQMADACNNLAALHMKQDGLAAAEAFYKEALRIYELLGHESLDVSDTLHNLAALHGKQGRLFEAEPLHKEALRIYELLGHDLRHVTALDNLAGVYEYQDRLAEAEMLYKEAVRIRELRLGHDSLDVAQTLHNLAGLREYQGRLAEAEALYKEALRIHDLLGHDLLVVSQIRNNLAALHYKQDRLAEAEGLNQSAISTVVELKPFSNDRVKLSLDLAAMYHRALKFVDASELMCQCIEIQRIFLQSLPLSESDRIQLFDSRLFVETSCLACKYQLMHDASLFPSLIRHLIDDSFILLNSRVAVQGASPYSVTTAARYLLIKVVEFAHGSDHAEAPRLRSEALERLAKLMMTQLVPPPLRCAARLAVAAVQWTPPSDTRDLFRRQQLVDVIDAAYVDAHWMMDHDALSQFDSAVEAFHDDVVLEMFRDHSVRSSQLKASPSVQNRVTQLFVQLNCILDHAWSRVVLPFCSQSDTAIYFRGDYSSVLAVKEELLVKTGRMCMPVFEIHHLQELLCANAAALQPALSDSNLESGRMFRVCGLPELQQYFTVSDAAPPNALKFSYKSTCGGAAVQQQLKATLEMIASRLHHVELYADVLSHWLKKFETAKAFEVSPLEDKTWITAIVGVLQDMGCVSRLKENRVFVHMDRLPTNSKDAKCQSLLRFVPEGFVDAMLDWMRRVGDSSFRPLLNDEADVFKRVIEKLNDSRWPAGELLQQVHGCWFFHRQRAIELNCKFDDAKFEQNVKDEEAKVQRAVSHAEACLKERTECTKNHEAASAKVGAALQEITDSGSDASKLETDIQEIKDSGGDASKLETAKLNYEKARALRQTAGKELEVANSSFEKAKKAARQTENGQNKHLNKALGEVKAAKSLQALMLPTIEDSRPRSWSALQNSMDCRRYRDVHGTPCGADEWDKAWSAPLVWISVDNKHVRLTPTLQSSNLKLSTHGFTFADARLTIDYVARRSFYPWTFVRVLAAEGVSNAVDLSEAILYELSRERHIVHGRVAHAHAVAYKDAVGANSSLTEQQHCKLCYQNALKDLADRTPQLSQLQSSPKMLAANADVMLKKILQESQLRQDPDFREDALLLLQKSFLGVQVLLQEFGREAHADAAEQQSLKQELIQELKAHRQSKIFNPLFAAPDDVSGVAAAPATVSADDCCSVRALFEWISGRGWFVEAEHVLQLVSPIAKDLSMPFWLRSRLIEFARGAIQHKSNTEFFKKLQESEEKLAKERDRLLFAGDIDADIFSQLQHCHAEIQSLEFDSVLYAAYSDKPAVQRGMLRDIESLVVQVCLKLRAVAEQSLMRALEPTVLRPRDDRAAAADGSWDIKFKGSADRASFCKWLAECNVSLDHVLACDGTWFTCSSVDGLNPGDAVFFVGDAIGGVSVTHPSAAAPTLHYICNIHAVDKSKFSLCSSPGAACSAFNKDSSSVMFVCRGSTLPLPPCIQRYPDLYKAVEQLFPHKVFSSHRDHQHEHEWLHLLFLITNYTKHEELRNVVLPTAQPVDGLQLCCVPYTIEGFAFTDAARDVLDAAASAADALQLSIDAVNEMKRSNVLTKGGDPCPQGAVLPAYAFTTLIDDIGKRASFAAEVDRVVAAVQVRNLPRQQRLLQPPTAMSAIRRPLMPMLRAAFDGALKFAHACAAVKCSHFKLSDAAPFQFQPSSLQLQFVMSPSDASAAGASFQLLLSQDGAMVPRAHPHAIPFLNGLRLHVMEATRLPKYADVQCFTDEVSMSLHVRCSLRGLLRDLFQCVIDSARRAMPAAAPAS